MIRFPFRGGAPLPASKRPGLFAGGVLVALGIALIGASVGYMVYARKAEAGLRNLVVTAPSGSVVDSLPKEWRDRQAVDAPTPVGVPATATPPSGTIPEPGAGDFRWADWNALPRTIGKALPATHVTIPAIGVDSAMVELNIVDDGGEQVWQRPKQSVGHHAGTANPGEIGNVVISGHINSPVRGEGSVFKRLPEIPRLLQAGQAVEVFISTAEKTYVYRIVASDVVKPEDVRVFEATDKPTLSVITCVPDRVFSDRLVLTGLLIKVSDRGYPPAGQRVDGVVVSPL